MRKIVCMLFLVMHGQQFAAAGSSKSKAGLESCSPAALKSVLDDYFKARRVTGNKIVHSVEIQEGQFDAGTHYIVTRIPNGGFIPKAQRDQVRGDQSATWQAAWDAHAKNYTVMLWTQDNPEQAAANLKKSGEEQQL